MLLEKICSVGAGIAFDSLLFSTLVCLLCVTARVLSYNDEISQLCLKWLEFLLALLSFCSILCSWLYLPQFYFLLIIVKWWKEAIAPQPERFTVEGDTQAFSTKSVCVGTDVGIHQISPPQHSSKAIPFIFPQTNHFWQSCRDFPLLPSLIKQQYQITVMREELTNVLSSYPGYEKLLENKWPSIAEASQVEGGRKEGEDDLMK